MPVNSFENYPMSWRPSITKGDGTPLYLAIAEALSRDIRAGLLQPGDKLPPQRELADFLDVNLSTITRAFKTCALKGLVTGTVGSGTYVAADIFSKLPLFERMSTKGVDMGAVQPLYAQNRYIVQAMKHILKKINVEKLLRYSKTRGKPEHRSNAARWLRSLGLDANPDLILIVSGLHVSIFTTLASLFEIGDVLATTSLTHPCVRNAANLLALRLAPLPSSKNTLDAEALKKLCRTDAVRGVYLSPDWQSPTACSMTAAEREAVASIVKKYDLICIEDATYSYLNDEPAKPVAAFVPHNTVYLAPVSHALGAGLRIAFISAPERHYSRIAKGIANISVMPSPFDAETVSQLIETDCFRVMADEKREELLRRNALADRILEGMPLHGSGACQFRWLAMKDGEKSARFEAIAKKRDIRILNDRHFFAGGKPVLFGARLAVSSPATCEELEKALETLRDIYETEIKK